MWFAESRNAKLSDCVQRFVKHNLKKNYFAFTVRTEREEEQREISWTCDKQTKTPNNENLLWEKKKIPIISMPGEIASTKQLGSASLQR